jgi:hypothetical protein
MLFGQGCRGFLPGEGSHSLSPRLGWAQLTMSIFT